MKSIDALLDQKYDPEKYHCVHFLIEAADYIFGLDYSDSFVGLTTSLHETLRTSRLNARQGRRINTPVDGTVVLMTNANQSSHVGLFYCGRVLHLTEMGVHFLPLITIQRFYKRIRYYEPITHSKEPA